MPSSMPQFDFPPNVPLKLISSFEDAGCNMSELARQLGINKAHIHKLFKLGIEPRDPVIRKKMFLPAKVREGIPAWVIEATQVLADLEEKAANTQKHIYVFTRDRKRIKVR